MLDIREYQNKCLKYLVNKYKDIYFKIENSLIKVAFKDNIFYICVKNNKFVIDQFQLINNSDNNIFEYDTNNINPLNKYSKILLDAINDNYDKYNDFKSHKLDNIVNDTNILYYNYIIETYTFKKIKFFINENYKVIKLNDILNAFNISAKFSMTKKSPGLIDRYEIRYVKEYLSTNFAIKLLKISNKRLYAKTKLELNNTKFRVNNIEYIFIQNDVKSFEIRKYFDIVNINVTFVAERNSNFIGFDLDELMDNI